MRVGLLLVVFLLSVACGGGGGGGGESSSPAAPTVFKMPKSYSSFKYESVYQGSLYVITSTESVPSIVTVNNVSYDVITTSFTLRKDGRTIQTITSNHYFNKGVIIYSLTDGIRTDYFNHNTPTSLSFNTNGVLLLATMNNGKSFTETWKFEQYSPALGTFTVTTTYNDNSYVIQDVLIDTEGNILSGHIILSINGTAMRFTGGPI
jgi:hypothetical protein